MNPRPMPFGPVLAAVAGIELSTADRERLVHPLVGGVTLFARNYADAAQLTALCAAIHGLREPRLLICVDHEGGRVQRFRDGFTRVPPMRSIGALWQRGASRARAAAHAAGVVIASELAACGVDLSFTPVLDLDYGVSSIIGDRALHPTPEVVTELAACLLDGLQEGGMAGVGKHFPGHGYIAADSHLVLPVDERDLETIRARDLEPFRALSSRLAAVMAAHVLYPQVDAQPAGFSQRWIRTILRRDLGYDGAVVSDDLAMAGAACAGSLEERAQAAFAAGCDLVLACTPDDADVVLSCLRYDMPAQSRTRLHAMFGTPASVVAGATRVRDARTLLSSIAA
ncbi:MAG: beta-N-acetylhexosaminidase [Betaproteobacteria bacterium]|nr:beta-N-acetylhexosaminidase [Betaproteobacteria bacterium]